MAYRSASDSVHTAKVDNTQLPNTMTSIRAPKATEGLRLASFDAVEQNDAGPPRLTGGPPSAKDRNTLVNAGKKKHSGTETQARKF